jgi:hypothetical protein
MQMEMEELKLLGDSDSECAINSQLETKRKRNVFVS